MTDATTYSTLIGLFHTDEQARETLAELQKSGIAPAAVQTIGDGEGNSHALTPAIQNLNLPERDLKMLSDGLDNGGIVIIVRADAEEAERAEAIIRRHNAHQVDEQIIGDPAAGELPTAFAGARSTDDASIPVVEEELILGKRTVQSGGVRVISRVTETPVTASVNLREEHARVERRPADRSATDADFRIAAQAIEVKETGEEAVVSKTARVVEEVFVDRETVERTEVVSDTVRHTEVEVEPITAGERTNTEKITRPSVRNDKESN